MLWTPVVDCTVAVADGMDVSVETVTVLIVVEKAMQVGVGKGYFDEQQFSAGE